LPQIFNALPKSNANTEKFPFFCQRETIPFHGLVKVVEKYVISTPREDCHEKISIKNLD